jgi:hypothetical protein
MASLEEAFGGTYGRKGGPKQEKIFHDSTRRNTAAQETHEKTIRELSKSLPIASAGKDDLDDNYTPSKHTTNQREPFSVQNYTPPEIPATPGYAYEPASLPGPPRGEWDRRVEKLIRRMDMQQTGETSTHDLVLYIFTGVFFLFVLDTFVTLGKRSR